MTEIYVTTPYDCPMSCHKTMVGAENFICDFIRKEHPYNQGNKSNKEILDACSVYIKKFELEE